MRSSPRKPRSSRSDQPEPSALPPEGLLHLRGFLDYLQAECGLSQNTRLAYKRDLRQFLAMLGERGIALEELSPNKIEAFVRRQQGRGLAESSVRRSLAAVRMFCRYLVIQNVLRRDISETVIAPKAWKRLPAVLDDSTVRTLIDEPDPGRDRHAVRDRAILAMLYAAGMRASELVGLRREAVHESLGVLRVLGKGSKERVVPIAREALEALRAYLLSERRPAPVDDGTPEPAFLSRTGRALSREDVWRIVRKYARRCGVYGKVGAHTLRHSFATQLLTGGADLRSVQEMLGHADIATTQIYTHVDASRLRSVHKKFHPRG